MKATTFYENLTPKVNFDKLTTTELQQISKKYPYFQLAAIMSLKAIKQNNPTEYKSYLAKVATKVINREVLFDFLYPEYQYSTPKQEQAPANIEDAKPVEAKKIETPKPLRSKSGSDIKSKKELMAEVNSRLAEIEKKKKEKEKSKISAKISTDKSVSNVENSHKNKKIIDKDLPVKHAAISKRKKDIKAVDRGSSLSIIENFIKTNPSINRPEDKNYSDEIRLANKSLEESYELVSETMAILFVKQGHPKKAIKVYEKLILIYPEKSTYFAARILELKN